MEKEHHNRSSRRVEATADEIKIDAYAFSQSSDLASAYRNKAIGVGHRLY